MDNGPACKVQTAQKMQEAGDVSGDMFEISTIRREVGVMTFDLNAAILKLVFFLMGVWQRGEGE